MGNNRKKKAIELKYDSKGVVADYSKYDVDGNEITKTYAKKKHTQKPLKSGYNIKTINGESILGSGNLEITAIPECPMTTDGTYTLEATVSNGSVVYNWVLKQ